jgi:hypothetical protein
MNLLCSKSSIRFPISSIFPVTESPMSENLVCYGIDKEMSNAIEWVSDITLLL